MIHYYFQQLIQFAQHNSIMFASIVIISFSAIFILTILLLNPKKIDIAHSVIQSNHSPHSSHSREGGNDMINQDIHAIAGDDVFVTQLDLARAYIELGNFMLAKQILENVILQGDQDQQQIAQELLLTL